MIFRLKKRTRNEFMVGDIDWTQYGIDLSESWRTAYGLKYPPVMLAVNGVICRKKSEKRVFMVTSQGPVSQDHEFIQILIGTRGPSARWWPNMPMVSFGGFVDPTDSTCMRGLHRENQEELPGITFEIEPTMFYRSGPFRFHGRWDGGKHKAISLGIPAQDIPVVTDFHIVWWKAGEGATNEEVSGSEWHRIENLRETSCEYAFDQAYVLEALLKHFKMIP